jgi:agmatinase
MHIDSFFAISNASLEDADYVIFGVPYDATQSFKSGSRFAPTAVREASWNMEEYSVYFDFSFDEVKICDAGNINVDGTIEDVIEKVARFMAKIKAIPVAIGGEHSISYMVARNMGEFCYLVFDAHFDLRDSFDGSPYNHACNSRRIHELGVDIVQVGVRSGTREERIFAEKNGIEVFYSWHVLKNGVDDVIDALEDYRNIYLSVDIDAFDPCFAPGVSTPEPFGLHPVHFLSLIEEIGDRIVGFDVTEVIPDSEKITQSLAAKLIYETIASTV